MATQTDTKTRTKTDDAFDVRRAVERWTEANRKAGNSYLDIYEQAVERLADLEVKTADAVTVPVVSSVVKTHADVTRRVAGTYVKATRELINA
jgi:urease accessory protein UreF